MEYNSWELENLDGSSVLACAILQYSFFAWPTGRRHQKMTLFWHCYDASVCWSALCQC